MEPNIFTGSVTSLGSIIPCPYPSPAHPFHLMFLFHSILSNPSSDRVSISTIFFISPFFRSTKARVGDTHQLIHPSLSFPPPPSLPSNSLKSLFRLPLHFNRAVLLCVFFPSSNASVAFTMHPSSLPSTHPPSLPSIQPNFLPMSSISCPSPLPFLPLAHPPLPSIQPNFLPMFPFPSFSLQPFLSSTHHPLHPICLVRLSSP